MLSAVTEEELSELYAWVDSVPLSRPKKSIARDFSDAVLVAEIVHHYFPRLVELHNYR
jgi:CH-like domain in sperm protein